MTTPEFDIHLTAEDLAEAIAAQLVTRLVGLQSAGGVPSIVLTGGGMGNAALAAVAASPTRDSVDWSRLDVWWGDERFLPAGDADRNETGSRAALLDQVPLDPARVHAMPASDGMDGADAEAAAARYAERLAAVVRPEDHGPVPTFDVSLLGVGPDGHVASLFPEQPALHEPDLASGGRTVLAVRGAPKPPPTRLSLTLPAINSAREVWLLVAGAEKADAVRLAFGGGPVQIPAAGVRGRQRTIWMLDQAAAKDLSTS